MMNCNPPWKETQPCRSSWVSISERLVGEILVDEGLLSGQRFVGQAVHRRFDRG